MSTLSRIVPHSRVNPRLQQEAPPDEEAIFVDSLPVFRSQLRAPILSLLLWSLLFLLVYQRVATREVARRDQCFSICELRASSPRGRTTDGAHGFMMSKITRASSVSEGSPMHCMVYAGQSKGERKEMDKRERTESRCPKSER